MDKAQQTEKILKEISAGNVKVIKELDLNDIFKLSYNFDLLKGLLTAILKNQENLKSKLEKERETNNEQSKTIELLQNDIKSMKENYITKEQCTHVNSKINEIVEQLNIIGEKSKSKKNIINKYI